MNSSINNAETKQPAAAQAAKLALTTLKYGFMQVQV